MTKLSALNRHSIFIFFAATLLFSLGLFRHDFIQFETRFGLFAQEMLRNGVSVFPTVYNKFYPDYTALHTFLIYLFSLPFGQVTVFSAVLPTALTSALTLALTFRLGAMHQMKWGWAAVLMCLFTLNFILSARSVSLDQFVATGTILTFYIMYSADFYHSPRRLFWLPCALLYGFAFRGPMGIVVPMGVVTIYYLQTQQIKRLILFAGLGLILLLLGSSVLIVFAYRLGGASFAHEVIRMQSLGRIHDLGHYPFYYYWQTVWLQYFISFPLVILSLLGIGKFPAKDKRVLWYLLGWLLVIMVGLSIPSEKKFRYLLPMVPAAALLAGYFFSHDLPKFLRHCRLVLRWIFDALPYAAIILILLCYRYGVQQQLHLAAKFFPAVLLLLMMLVAFKNLYFDENIKSLAKATCTFLILIIFVVQPLQTQFNSSSAFVQHFETLYHAGQTVTFYKIGPDAEDVKFMVTYKKVLPLQFVASAEQLQNENNSNLLISKLADFNALPTSIRTHFDLLYVGKIGHQTCVIFSKKGAS